MKKMIIDRAHSEIGFKVKHLMISTVKGKFNTFSGFLDENGELSVSMVTNSIDTGNIDRDNHLKSADFFNSEEYSTIKFGGKISEDINTITGEVTIKGITKEVTLNTEYNGMSVDPWGNTKHGWEISGSINRGDFGLTWNAPLETGGLLLSDEVKLTLDVQRLEMVEQTEPQTEEAA